MLDTIVIGAGITGILAAKKFNAPIIEKSRNVGGRFASRRFSHFQFNFGTRSFSYIEELDEEIFTGIKQGILELRDNIVYATKSFNDWTKSLAADINIEIDEIKSVSRNSDHWVISSESKSRSCRRLIVTAPAPQAYQLFEDKSLCSHLVKVDYHSQMFFMCSSEQKVCHEQLQLLDCCFRDGLYYSLFLIDQSFNEKSREEIRSEWDSKLELCESFAHKWRYSRVANSIEYKQTHPELFLLGDYYEKDVWGAVSSLQYLNDSTKG